MIDLKIKVLLPKEQQQVVSGGKSCFCSSKIELPADLPTVEESLQILAAALRRGAKVGLDKDEVGLYYEYSGRDLCLSLLFL